MKKATKVKKQLIIKVGNHFVDPTDVSCITKIKSKNLYVVRLKSQPNMEYPIWVREAEIEVLLEYFDIKTSDVNGEDE